MNFLKGKKKSSKGGGDVQEQVSTVMEEITSLYPGLKRLKKHEVSYLKEDFVLLVSHASDQILELKRLVLRILSARSEFSFMSKEASQAESGVQLKARNASEEAKRLKEQIDLAKVRLKKLKAEVTEGRDQDRMLSQKIRHVAGNSKYVQETVKDLHGEGGVDDLLGRSTAEIKSFNDRLKGFSANVHDMVEGMKQQQTAFQQRLSYIEAQHEQAKHAKATRTKAVAGLKQLEGLVSGKKVELEVKKKELNALMIRAKRRSAHEEKKGKERAIREEQERAAAVEQAKVEAEAKAKWQQKRREQEAERQRQEEERQVKIARDKAEKIRQQQELKRLEAQRQKELAAQRQQQMEKQAAEEAAEKKRLAALEKERLKQEKKEKKLREKAEAKETARRAKEAAEAKKRAMEEEAERRKKEKEGKIAAAREARAEAKRQKEQKREEARAKRIKDKAAKDYQTFLDKKKSEKKAEEARKDKERVKREKEEAKQRAEKMKRAEKLEAQKRQAEEQQKKANEEGKKWKQKRERREFVEKEIEKIRQCLKDMDTLLLEDDPKVEDIEAKMKEMEKMKQSASKNNITGKEVDMLEKYLNKEKDEMGVHASKTKREKMDQTVKTLVKKSLEDRDHDLKLDHEEGEGLSPFNIAALLGFFGDGFGGGSAKSEHNVVEKYAL